MYLKTILSLLVLIQCQHVMFASQFLSDGDKVIVYGDDTMSRVFKLAKSDIKDVLKKRKIKCDEKKKKGARVSDLASALNKDIISKGPRAVIIIIPVSDIYDAKAKTMIAEYDSDKTFASITSMLKELESTGISAALSTPCLAGEDVGNGDAVNKAIDALSERIRGYCKEHKIPCCDYRKAACAFLEANNTDQKKKGVLSKDGVKINKKGAEILVTALIECLGIASNSNGITLKESDRVVLFTGQATPFGGGGATHIVKNLQVQLDKQFAHIADFIRPSFKAVNLSGQDGFFKPVPATTPILSQKARVSFVHFSLIGLTRDNFDKNKQNFISKFQSLSEVLNEQSTGSVYVMTGPAANPDPTSPDHLARLEFNEIIIQSARDKENVHILDLYELHKEARKKNPEFVLLRTLAGTPYYSIEFLDLMGKEMATIIGLKQ